MVSNAQLDRIEAKGCNDCIFIAISAGMGNPLQYAHDQNVSPGNDFRTGVNITQYDHIPFTSIFLP